MPITVLEQAILKTVCYFDLFDYPLTSWEIYKWLIIEEQPEAVALELGTTVSCLAQSDFLRSRLGFKNGFYFLLGRESLPAARLERYQLTKQKYQLAERGLRALAACPFVQTVALCNNFGFNNLRQDSDIDLFLVVSPGRLYLVRLLATAIITLLGLRPSADQQADRFCLSFYTAENNLDLSSVKITGHDLYLGYWLTNLVPVFGQSAADDLFVANSWLKEFLPHTFGFAPSGVRQISGGSFSRGWKIFWQWPLAGRLGNWAESLAKKLQLKKLSPAKLSLARLGDGRVVISDAMLKFHENDRRFQYLQAVQKKYVSLL
ncbi:MAG: hypothetical protein WC518_03260 [Patescibacteria group bacterium]